MCSTCPDGGGACDGEGGYYSEGLTPAWSEAHAGLRPSLCQRWSGYARRRRLLSYGIPEAMLTASLSNYHPQNDSQQLALSKVAQFARSAGREERMLLWGHTGVGKTHLACAALALLADRGSVMFAYVPDFVDTVRAETFSGSDATMMRARSVDYLVLDDLGAERGTDFVREVLEKLLNARLGDRRSVIFTMNVSPDAVAATLGPPLVRRVMSATRTVMDIKGTPYDETSG